MLLLTWGLRHFWKREHQKRMRWYRGLRHLCILYVGASRKLYAKPVCFLVFFLVIKEILRVLFTFIPWLLSFYDLPGYGSNSSRRYTLRLLSKCLGRSIPPFWGEPFDPNFGSLRWAPFSLALDLCSSKFITKWCKIYTKTDSSF